MPSVSPSVTTAAAHPVVPFERPAPAPVPPSVPAGVCALGLVLGLAVAPGLSNLHAAPPDTAIEASTLRLDPAGLRFQFRSAPGESSDFEVWSAIRLSEPSSWSIVPDARVEPVADGVFLATVRSPGEAQLFLRIRRIHLPPAGPVPRLNEVVADNVAGLAAEDGRFWDWIEVFNPHDETLDLTGYRLSEDPDDPDSWRFPSYHLAPGAYGIVFASGLDQAIEGAPLHANFRLDSAGQTLVLFDSAGREVDRVTLPPLGPDQPLALSPDGTETWHLLRPDQATPGRENPATTEPPVIDAPRFTVPPGFHRGPLEIALVSGRPDWQVHLTTNGAPATAASSVHRSPWTLDRTTVVRAVNIDPQGRRSREIAGTFFVNVSHPLPVVSLVGDPAHFAFRDGYLYGMGNRVLGSAGQVLQSYPYSGSNAWQDREVQVHLEFFEPDGVSGLRQWVGLKVFGGWGSRGYPQKSLALFARRQYGDGRMNHAVFPGSDVDSFEALVLRNSGNDNQGTWQTPPRPPIVEFGPTRSYGSYFVNGTFTLMRDGMMQQLLADTGLDTQAYRPAVVYLNGDPWGIYNLREKLNEHYVTSHHRLPDGAIDLIEGYGDVRAGDDRAYRAMRDFINTRNPSAEVNYREIIDRYLERDNFIDYNLAVIYFQNFDIGNIKCWRPRTPRGRFRWLVFDQDYGFGLWPPEVYVPAMARDYADYDNMFRFATAGTGTSTAWPNGGGRTLLLRRMLLHRGFQERFIVRCADLLNSRFREDQVVAVIDRLAAVIRPEMADHLRRWSWDELQARGFGAPHQEEREPFTLSVWERHVEGLRAFARSRPAALRSDCLEHFRLSGGLGTLNVHVTPPGAGDVRVNSLNLDSYPWQGTYFGAYPNAVQAIARPGYRFVEWSTPAGLNPDNPVTWTVADGAVHTLAARFEPQPPGVEPAERLWITEINYHSPEDLDSDDWIELHNPGAVGVRLAGWVLRDQVDDRAFPLPDVVLAPGGYLVLCRDDVRFGWTHPDLADPAGVFPFGLGNEGDTVRLFDARGVLVVSVAYDDDLPWPETADGGGSTLELHRPDLDPSSPAAWRPSTIRGGSPGRSNSAAVPAGI